MIDIADVSVEQARSRYQSMDSSRFEASFAALDCYTEPLAKAFSPAKLSTQFDVVSMQFCMHYAFETLEKTRIMLDNVSRYLRPGGVFIGTIPNAELLMCVSCVASGSRMLMTYFTSQGKSSTLFHLTQMT